MKSKKKKRVRRSARYARGNMDVSLALIRCALACSAFIVTAGALSVSGVYSKWPEWISMLVQTALTVLCFGLPARRGLFVADGDQSDKLCRRTLGPGQMLYLSAAGVLLVCPVTLLYDLISAPFVRMGLAASASAAPPFALFVPMLVKSALIAPVCEELFFRGYLPAVLKEAGLSGAALVSSLFFALVHGVDAMLLPRFLLGLLLYALMVHTDSLFAAVLVHAAYNLTLLLLSYSGLGALFSGIGLVSCLIRLVGCAAFVSFLRRVYLARRAEGQFRFGRKMTFKQTMLYSLALAALIYFSIVMTVLDMTGAKV